ncbi:hypothetical protein, partial [uncultured Jannaschia sp.]|uniref:hypothetical protein n=1 Tax=uncultured Jannaschia sp. TaxID=293347 RepID=UPI002605FE53
GTDSFDYTVSDGALEDTATVRIKVGGEPINVWSGSAQTFGLPGEAQSWINILGNVSDDVVRLSYILNGGAPRTLAIGPDTRRLQADGDFNADIAYADLDGSATDDLVTLIARMSDGSTYEKNIVIDYESGRRWSPDYAIDWSEVGAIEDAVQIVDGRWIVTADGLRSAEPGYDRVVAIGDEHWDNYELTVPITMHDLDTVDPRGRDGGAFGFGMLWSGHSDDPISGKQPKAGWNPSELLYYENKDGGRMFFFGRSQLDYVTLEEGETYNFTLRVEQVDGMSKAYSLKVWDVDATEPTDWLMERTMTYDEPRTGSLLLVSHYYDVSFGDVNISKIVGSDTLVADKAGGALIAVDPDAGIYGRSEIDVMRGGQGEDVFVFGSDGTVFYDDLDPSSEGTEDYVLIWDFVSGQDLIRLSGAPGDYDLERETRYDGTAIWHDAGAGTVRELIGIVANITDLTLDGPGFSFPDLIA